MAQTCARWWRRPPILSGAQWWGYEKIIKIIERQQAAAAEGREGREAKAEEKLASQREPGGLRACGRASEGGRVSAQTGK